jgi:hypothetical protein
VSAERVRNRFKPEDPCRCGQTYAVHERRPGFGERKGHPPRLHCPGKHSWTRVTGMGELKREYHFAAANGRGLPGGGPWRILDECSARYHNTRRATESVDNKCICPHALDEAKLKKVLRKQGNILEKVLLTPLPHSVRVPDFSAGLCARPERADVVDGGFSVEGTLVAMDKREAAKRLCYACPIREEVCAPYVKAAENPPGSWRGVWAGKDPWERQGRRVVIGPNGVELVSDASARL